MENAWILLATLVVYFLILLGISVWLGKRRDNDAFFSGNRQSRWWLVSIGMIGASVSGVSFVSVPGMVGANHYLYMQTVMGFFVGYLLIARILLPLYYRLENPSIYAYLMERFGSNAQRTGSAFFLLSKGLGAAARVYIVALLLHTLVFQAFSIPFEVGIVLLMGMIWLYTRHSGIKTLVWTDAFQTLIMVAALVLLIVSVGKALDGNWSETFRQVEQSPWFQWFEWKDWHSKQHVGKQFFSGIFIALVMTGLDQDMIQKNRSIPRLKDAQTNMYVYGFAFIPLNFLFLFLGTLILLYAQQEQIVLPQIGDEILPMLATEGSLGFLPVWLFTLSLVAASFSSADSSMTALTTSFCIDIAKRPNDVRFRKRVHLGVVFFFIVAILAFRWVNNPSIIDLIYVLASYTYGPLLGLFAFGLLSRRHVHDRSIPYIAILSPLICMGLQFFFKQCWQYEMGYELLMLNGALTFFGLFIQSKKRPYGN